MLGPACRELVLGTNTGCWAPILGAGHLYWVLGTYTGFWAPILGAAAEHQVLSACGWVLVQGAGIGIMVLGRVPVWGSWCWVGCKFGIMVPGRVPVWGSQCQVGC